RRPDKRCTKAFGLQVGSTCNQLQNRHVGSVSVSDENSLKPVTCDALGDIQDEVKKVLHLDIDRSWEIHMMSLEAIRDDGQQEDLTVGAFRGFFAYAPDQKIVRVERKMRPMVFDRSNRKDNDRLSCHNSP